MRVLVVEDEPRIAGDLAAALIAAGFLVDIAADGETAWFKGDTEDFAAVVLDLGLPRLDGLAILKRWRGNGRHMPVLVLTARGTWAERVEGIDAGADDYLPKPFRMEELVARTRALIRRSAGVGTATLDVGPLSVDPRQMRVTVAGRAVALSPLEYRLVTYLVLHKGRVVAPHELIEQLYGDDDARDANALEALVMRLRKKLGAELIETRRGFGYVLAAPVERGR